MEKDNRLTRKQKRDLENAIQYKNSQKESLLIMIRKESSITELGRLHWILNRRIMSLVETGEKRRNEMVLYQEYGVGAKDPENRGRERVNNEAESQTDPASQLDSASDGQAADFVKDGSLTLATIPENEVLV